MSEVLNPPDPERADLPPEKSEVLNLPDPERADLPPDKSEVLKPQTKNGPIFHRSYPRSQVVVVVVVVDVEGGRA
ncbi:unnamed protein product [Boreogadus saida]